MNKSRYQQKLITSGADGGPGGVGFGVPAQYGISNTEAASDPVLERHNERVAAGKTSIFDDGYDKQLYDSLLEKLDGERIANNARQTRLMLSQRHASVNADLFRITEAVLTMKNIYPEFKKLAEDARLLKKTSALFQKASDRVDNLLNQMDPDQLDESDDWVSGTTFLYNHFPVALDPSDDSMDYAEWLERAKDILLGSPASNVIERYENKLEQVRKEMAETLATTQTAMEDKVASKATGERFFEELGIPITGRINAPIPETVPNYHIAFETSPRVCGNCRFFKGTEGQSGQCTAFDFEAKANYVCDAWQAQALSSSHTVMRDEGKRGQVHGGKTDNNTPENKLDYTSTPRSPMQRVDGKPKVIPGRVRGQRHDLIPVYQQRVDTAFDIDYNTAYSNDAMSHPVLREENNLLPGDLVYSNNLQSLAVVEGVVDADNEIYQINLIDNIGVAKGTATASKKDLVQRSKRATKSSSLASTFSDDIEGAVAATQEVYNQINTAVLKCEDWQNNLISYKDVITPLTQLVGKTLQLPAFASVTTGQKRKYRRALQHCLASLGAARQVLVDGYRTIATVKEEQPDEVGTITRIMQKAQEDAYDRLKQALSEVHDALTLPSATHGEPGPGLKSTPLWVIEQLEQDLISGFYDMETDSIHHIEGNRYIVELEFEGEAGFVDEFAELLYQKLESLDYIGTFEISYDFDESEEEIEVVLNVDFTAYTE